MRLIVQLQAESKNEITLPIHYNYFIQSALYKTLDREFASFLHNQGYEGGGRRFKLFTFSRLFGEYRIFKSEITFRTPIKLIVSSPANDFCQSLVNGLLGNRDFQIGNRSLQVESVQIEKPLVEDDILKMRLLSPVVAYSTLLRPEGGKYTCYFQPGDSDFTRIANENLRKKYNALFHQNAPEGTLSIRPLRQPKLHVMKYKGIVIKGYSASLELKGPIPLLQLALDAGIGSKNSMGFGCGEIVKYKSKQKLCTC